MQMFFQKYKFKIIKKNLWDCQNSNFKFNLIFLQFGQLEMMNRAKSTTRKSSTSNATSKNKITNKKQLSDTVYLMQNENQILKLKYHFNYQRNQQLSYKIDSLNSEVRQRTQRIADKQKQCQQLRQAISDSIYIKDIQLESERKVLMDRLVIANQNVQIYKDKIADTRRQVVIEEERIPVLRTDKKRIQEDLRIVKMQNQGFKKVLIRIEEENEEMREQNNQLSLKKYSKQPQQKAISQEIQQRIRLIKNINLNQRNFKKQKSAELLIFLLHDLVVRTKKICYLTTQRYGIRKVLIKKKFLHLTMIRKKYLNSVKSRVMSIFRQPLKPLVEEQKCIRILQQIRKRRQKAKIWRIWRNESAKAEYSLIRKYECQTTIEKVGQTILKSFVIFAFNKLKYFNSHHRSKISLLKFFSTLSETLNKPKLQFFQILEKQRQKYLIQQEIQNGAIEQSQMLILSKIFYGWVALMKEKKNQSLSLKYKYFKRLKKIFVIRKRNILNQMLGETKIKINDINIKSVCFAALKRQLYTIKQQRKIEEQEKLSTTLINLNQDTENRLILDEQINKQMALFKIQSYLQKKVKEAMGIWRKENQRSYAVNKIVSLVSFYLQKSVNYAFSRIQIRRFQKLKKSIRDKIQSCDFSYNYLVEENTHIKQVLDKKSHELQKAKFTTIIQRLIRNEKQIKLKYFYKFMKNGFKCWKVKKSLLNIDSLMKKKISLVFFFLLKLNKNEKIQHEKIQYFTQRNDDKIIRSLLKRSIEGFKKCTERNKRIKRALFGVFDRNLELNFYQAFGKIRDEFYGFQLNQIQENEKQIQQEIKETDQNIKSTEQIIEILSERLKTKQRIFKERKTMSIYKFFLKNVKTKVGSYIWKWKNKVDQEKRVINFVNVLQRKTQSMVKMRFLLAIQKSKEQIKQKQLQSKLQRYTYEYENANENYEKFISVSQQRMAEMQAQNVKNDQIIKQYQEKTQKMNIVKANQFQNYWGKNICKFVFRQWKNRKNSLIQRFNRIFYLLGTHSIRDAFQTLSAQVKLEFAKDRIKKNLSTIYTKSYRHNTGLCFKIWRNVNIITKVKQCQGDLKEAMKGKQHIEEHYENVRNKYLYQVDRRINSWKLRRLTNAWRIYTQKKLRNNVKLQELSKWLSIGYCVNIVRQFREYKNKSIGIKKKVKNFQKKCVMRRIKGFLQYLKEVLLTKKVIKKLFIQKFCYYKALELKQEFFSRTKNYQKYKQIQQKDRRTFCIQKVIYTFQKKRKDILCQNMRIWKRNMYVMQIQKNLLKRLVRKAMNNQVKDLFYAWKLQTQARFMVRQHTEEGQVKKRKVEIKRLKKFIEQFKKEKGLLLEDQEGNFVVSPKFQQKKEKQLKRENLLKYKFISRLILSMNGYQAPVKSWKNLRLFTKLRTKCQKSALMIQNRMQKPDLYTSFRIWRTEVQQIRKSFEDMERKDLIRLLNRQKDRMQIEYGKKIEVEQEVERELRRYKLLSYQDKRKERIFAQILFREARKVKSFAFETWRKRAEELRDHELYDLEDRGNNKLLTMQEQIHDLERTYRQIEQNNRMLKQAVQQALEMAEMIKRISQERDQLQRALSESNISCENLQQENQELNNKLILAQKEAMNLLSLSNKEL